MKRKFNAQNLLITWFFGINHLHLLSLMSAARSYQTTVTYPFEKVLRGENLNQEKPFTGDKFYMDNFKIYETQIKDLVTTVCSSDTNSYPFGFNGQLKDNEAYGEGNLYDFGARIYDPRIGKFMRIDPDYQKYVSMSPYLFAANSPIQLIDANGEGPIHPWTGESVDLNPLWNNSGIIRIGNDMGKGLGNKSLYYDRVYTGGEKNQIRMLQLSEMLSSDNDEGPWDGGMDLAPLIDYAEYGSFVSEHGDTKSKYSNFGTTSGSAWSQAINTGNYTYIDTQNSRTATFGKVNEVHVFKVVDNVIAEDAKFVRTKGNHYEIATTTKYTTEIKSEKVIFEDNRHGFKEVERTISITEEVYNHKTNKTTTTTRTRTEKVILDAPVSPNTTDKQNSGN